MSVDLYLAIIGYIDAADEVQEGGFAGAAASSQRHFLASDKCCVKRLQDGMQLLAFMEAACQIRQAHVTIGSHTNPGIWWGHSSFNTLDQESPLFRCQQRFLSPGTVYLSVNVLGWGYALSKLSPELHRDRPAK